MHHPDRPRDQDPRTERLCAICKISDYIDSSGLPTQVLASISFQPRLRPVLSSLLSDDGSVHFMIRRVDDYIPKGTECPRNLSFLQAQTLVCCGGDAPVGWTAQDRSEKSDSPEDGEDLTFDMTVKALCADAHLPMRFDRWEMNPSDKEAPRPWGEADQLVVLGCS